jgi:PAT family beta-lactamase induction signal transducer AmpG
LIGAVVCPFADFFQRMGLRVGIPILLLVMTYRLNYTTMGVAANTFYLDMGFTLDQIALVSKVYGIAMTMAGAVLAGLLIRRMGIPKTMLLGGAMLCIANLLYAHMAAIHPGVAWLASVVSADNIANGIAGTAFIAYMSSLTNAKYTATQYALFGTLWSLPAKTIASQWGKIVDAWGYPPFFVYTALIGVPSLLLVLWLIRHERLKLQSTA